VEGLPREHAVHLGVGQWNVLGPSVANVRDRNASRQDLAQLRERLDHDGTYYGVHGYFLMMNNPQPPPPIILGALNPQMLRAGGEVADGVCLNWIGAHAVADALAHVQAGPRETTNAVFVRVCVTDDVASVRRWARREVMSYVTVPAYRTAFGVQGWSDVTAKAMELWDAGDRKGAAASLPDGFLDSLVIAGTADDVGARGRDLGDRAGLARGDDGDDEPVRRGDRDPDVRAREELERVPGELDVDVAVAHEGGGGDLRQQVGLGRLDLGMALAVRRDETAPKGMDEAQVSLAVRQRGGELFCVVESRRDEIELVFERLQAGQQLCV